MLVACSFSCRRFTLSLPNKPHEMRASLISTNKVTARAHRDWFVLSILTNRLSFYSYYCYCCRPPQSFGHTINSINLNFIILSKQRHQVKATNKLDALEECAHNNHKYKCRLFDSHLELTQIGIGVCSFISLNIL